MSTNNLINQTPGLRRIEEVYPRPQAVPNLGAKVTGRNLAAISLIVSLEAERRGVELGISTNFGADGSLQSITVEDKADGRFDVELLPGQYVVLLHDQADAYVTDEITYKHFYRES